MRDLTAAIIPALHDHHGKVLIAVDDLSNLTPTLVAFWLAVFDAAQVVGGASQKKAGLAKLWWKMTEIDIPPLAPEATRQIVETYIVRQGMLIEAPGLFVGHVVKQSGGNAQAIADLLDDSAKERLVDKRTIRAMRHAAGVRYVDSSVSGEIESNPIFQLSAAHTLMQVAWNGCDSFFRSLSCLQARETMVGIEPIIIDLCPVPGSAPNEFSR